MQEAIKLRLQLLKPTALVHELAIEFNSLHFQIEFGLCGLEDVQKILG